MSDDIKSVYATLQKACLVNDKPLEDEAVESPWFVKVLLAFSAWLAAAFLLGFVGALFESILDNKLAAIVIGLVMIGGAYSILRMPKNEFVKHLALALSFAGQTLVVWSIFRFHNLDDSLAWGIVMLLQASLALFMPDFIHRVVSSYFAAIALALLLESSGALHLYFGLIMFSAAYLWLNEFKYPTHMRALRAIGYGQVLALIQIKGSVLLQSGLSWRWRYKNTEIWVQPWVGEIISSIVMIYVVWQLLQRYANDASQQFVVITLISVLVFCAVSMEANGISVGMVILLVGFAGSNRILMGLGIVSLLFYISSYYYLLDTTLLAKAQTLFVVGLVLFSGRWLMLRVLSKTQEAQNV